jgi:hypothetical protein
VLLPEISAMAPAMTPGLRRADRRQREHQHQSYQKTCENFFHYSPSK